MGEINNDTPSGLSTDQRGDLHALVACQATFSIATPAVTQIRENLNDASFLHQSHSYHQETTIETHQTAVHPTHSTTSSALPSLIEPASQYDCGPQGKGAQVNETDNNKSHSGDSMSAPARDDNNKTNASTVALLKKKSKTNKKSPKLDTKSKLEKSRQSARECRARKKLRYQYLEDLVCNREKAVVKLREELVMFCQMSEKMDTGTISENDRHFLFEQVKENNKSS